MVPLSPIIARKMNQKANQTWIIGAAFAAGISVATTAHAGEISDCVFDRLIEYVHNGTGPIMRSLMLTMQVCVGHVATDEEMAEVGDGIRRAQEAIEAEARGGDKI